MSALSSVEVKDNILSAYKPTPEFTTFAINTVEEYARNPGTIMPRTREKNERMDDIISTLRKSKLNMEDLQVIANELRNERIHDMIADKEAKSEERSGEQSRRQSSKKNIIEALLVAAQREKDYIIGSRAERAMTMIRNAIASSKAYKEDIASGSHDVLRNMFVSRFFYEAHNEGIVNSKHKKQGAGQTVIDADLIKSILGGVDSNDDVLQFIALLLATGRRPAEIYELTTFERSATPYFARVTGLAKKRDDREFRPNSPEKVKAHILKARILLPYDKLKETVDALREKYSNAATSLSTLLKRVNLRIKKINPAWTSHHMRALYTSICCMIDQKALDWVSRNYLGHTANTNTSSHYDKFTFANQLTLDDIKL